MAGGKASKTKGSNGEREACKMLADIFQGSFIRSPHSGAFIGGKNAVRKAVLSQGQTATLKGDIVPPDFMPRFVIECKTYSEFRFHQLILAGTCAQLDEWMQQCLDVIDPDDEWVIIFKITRIGWFVAIPEAASPAYLFNNHCAYTGKYGSMRVTDMTDFFTVNKDAVLHRTA